MNNKINNYAQMIKNHGLIASENYEKYNIKQGLRNQNGTGVIVGITNVGAVLGYETINGKKIAIEGKLLYRNIEIRDLMKKISQEHRFLYERVIYLLLFSKLPNNKELKEFIEILHYYQKLPEEFVEDFILRKPSKNMMNMMQRSVLSLYNIDDNPDEITINNLVRQALLITAKAPIFLAYNHQAISHKYNHTSLVLRNPKTMFSMAENILHMLRNDGNFSELEAKILDVCLIIHADHGGGNNSAFTTHVVSSTNTDSYSAISASIGSLKGPKHGGASEKVKEMIDNIKANIDTKNEKELKDYLLKIINKKVFDQKGLIYGMGHAIYTYSDPRAEILKQYAYELALEKDMLDEYNIYINIEKLAKEIFEQELNNKKVICANVDLYAGLVYQMLNLPKEIYTSLFSVARIASWNAHRIEQIFSDSKIIRPAYISLDEDGNALV